MWCERFKAMDHVTLDKNPEEMGNMGNQHDPEDSRGSNGSKGSKARQTERNLMMGLMLKISNTAQFWVKIQSKE